MAAIPIVVDLEELRVFHRHPFVETVCRIRESELEVFPRMLGDLKRISILLSFHKVNKPKIVYCLLQTLRLLSAYSSSEDFSCMV
jgi:hypothetical protein